MFEKGALFSLARPLAFPQSAVGDPKKGRCFKSMYDWCISEQQDGGAFGKELGSERIHAN
jgi:hypothetical protein